MIIDIPYKSGQWVSANPSNIEGELIIGFTNNPLNSQFAIPIEQALLLADLIYTLAGSDDKANYKEAA